MHKETTITLSLLLLASLIMSTSATTNTNFNLISNSMAFEESSSYPYRYTQQIYSDNNDDTYKDDGRNLYYSQQSQNEQSERYQTNDNVYGYNNNYNDNANYDDTYYSKEYNYGYPPEKPILNSLHAEGTFFVSDAGESHGGFEFTAEYKTEFDVTNGIGTLTLTQITGLGDPLEKHVYSITDLRIEKNEKITMNIDDNYVELIFVESDEIWNHQFDNHYIASWGGFAPENEIKGVISPTIFQGLPDFWYVELRIPAVY
ncbi:MAG TPA: hypothetical protein VLA74_00950 [Nitrososphaeraceae archaeon]|nr:hypothetical protein [Nitrososphaeraceae archaeon]